MGDELAGVLHEVGEQPELGRGEVDLGAAQVRPVIVEVDDEVAVLAVAGVAPGRRSPPDAAPPPPGPTAPGTTAAS